MIRPGLYGCLEFHLFLTMLSIFSLGPAYKFANALTACETFFRFVFCIKPFKRKADTISMKRR